MDKIVAMLLAWVMGVASAWGIGAPATVAPPQSITVMSFNVFTDKPSMEQRSNGVVQTIRSEMPDSIGLQEAHARWRIVLGWALGDTYGMACWIGRDAAFDEGVPILYNKDKYWLLRQGVFWLSETPSVVSVGWDAELRRVAGYAVLKDKETGFTYVHLNTHFDHIGALARENSAKLLLEKVKEFGHLPVVITGDLNTTYMQAPVQTLVEGGFEDTRVLAAVTDTGATMNHEGASAAIDYVLVDHFVQDVQEFKVIREAYDGQYPSDHFAVCAKMTLEN
jgi:endonuclease/exonuclease/phosphatase family metal-dependent hydrolase